MVYATAQTAQALKTAREGKGLSQRALAKLAGLPQSHISRIEAGAVDLRLSSLVEIARALDLEVTLVPRKNLAAVHSIVRNRERPATQVASGPSLARALRKLDDSVRDALQDYPAVKELAQMRRQARDLQRLPSLDISNLGTLREAARTVRAFRDSSEHLNNLRRSLSAIHALRNAIVHEVPRVEAVKPAYSLEEDDLG